MTRLTRPRQRRSEVPKVLMGRLVVGRALPLSAMGDQAVDHLKWGFRWPQGPMRSSASSLGPLLCFCQDRCLSRRTEERRLSCFRNKQPHHGLLTVESQWGRWVWSRWSYLWPPRVLPVASEGPPELTACIGRRPALHLVYTRDV